MMKIYGQFSDPANGPFNGLIHKPEYMHALDTSRLKNDDIYGEYLAEPKVQL